MTVRRFKVSMTVPLGERRGRLFLHEVDGKIDGMLEILGRIQPISGFLSTDGKCKLYGDIVTAVRTIPFRALGSIVGSRIDLTLRGDKKDLFHITGEEDTISAYGEVL